MIETAEIERLVKVAFPDAEVSAKDLTGGGDHFELTVVSSAFEGRSPVERHRMIYAPLGEALRTAIHALSIRARTPEESAATSQPL